MGAAGLIFGVSLGSSATMGWILTVDQNLGVGEAFGPLLLEAEFVATRVPSMTLAGKQGMWFTAYSKIFLRGLSISAWQFIHVFLLPIVYLVIVVRLNGVFATPKRRQETVSSNARSRCIQDLLFSISAVCSRPISVLPEVDACKTCYSALLPLRRDGSKLIPVMPEVDLYQNLLFSVSAVCKLTAQA